MPVDALVAAPNKQKALFALSGRGFLIPSKKL
jgi:hypothetical protein